MNARRYKKKDYHLIQEWMQAREMDIPKESRLPKWGIIVGECVMVFLVKTDCKFAFLEYFITDPNASEESRKAACDIGITIAEAEAQRLDYDMIGAIVTIPHVVGFLLSHDYLTDSKPYVSLRKLLKGKENGRAISPSDCISTIVTSNPSAQ